MRPMRRIMLHRRNPVEIPINQQPLNMTQPPQPNLAVPLNPLNQEQPNIQINPLNQGQANIPRPPILRTSFGSQPGFQFNFSAPNINTSTQPTNFLNQQNSETGVRFRGTRQEDLADYD
jgi:hypothetical protein